MRLSALRAALSWIIFIVTTESQLLLVQYNGVFLCPFSG